MKENYFTKLLLAVVPIVAGYFILQQTLKGASITPVSNRMITPLQNQHRGIIGKKDQTSGVILKQLPSVKSAAITTQQAAASSSNSEIYTNDRLGITFQYPNTWTKDGEESNAINRNGGVMSILVGFVDSISHSNFFIEYHLAPYGAELYKYAKAQFDSSQGAYASEAKQIKVAGKKAIEAFSTMSKDIKGNIVNPPVRIISIRFLDKQQTGEFELHFKTPLPNEAKEVVKFKRVISTIKFTN